MSKINLVLIGSGKFGQAYIKTLATFLDVELIVANRQNWQSLIDNKPDGVLIVTDPSSHIEIGHYALHNAIPTLIEKPLSLSLTEAQSLLQFNSVPILVNHIHLFSKDYQNIKKQIKPNEIKHITLAAGSDNPPRSYSRLWDYAPHDIAMAIDLAQQYPINIQCEQDKDCYSIKLSFDTFDADIDIWRSGKRIRVLNINYGLHLYDGMASIDLPLTNALQVFIDAIHGKPDYRLGLDLSLQVMKVLEECQTQLDMQAF
jgi:hypothetical protein